ncbi:MAG TPA: urocanate hydratase [Tissierellia bacterium]|jgi:urocanate hydratase|nr:urocanate hydratase [Tissierellia bacterium]
MNLTFEKLPEKKAFLPGIRRAPKRPGHLNEAEKELALANALRYIPVAFHDELADEFREELETHGRIYGYRFRPEGRLYAKPVEMYPGKILEAKAIQVMIDNNLDFDVALYPYELVTYGESGAIFQNWMQYLLVKKYLAELEEDETLVLMSGHPLGVFPSKKDAPRLIITNGLMVGLYDDLEHFNKAAALGVANYGQMTAGGMMYIGPQGIVHGTYNTLLGAARLKLETKDNLSGVMYVTSGLGGMSGAQGKAVKIAGGVGIVAEVDASRIQTRLDQGWIDASYDRVEEVVEKALFYKEKGEAIALAYHGNIITLLEYLREEQVEVELISDQTSCHVPYEGGYCPVDLSFEERTKMLKEDPKAFAVLVDKSLQRHYQVIKDLTERGSYFFDYGNSFMKAVFDAGVKDIARNGIDETDGFIWPSYVEDIMGPLIFDYGYGPFRWVCLSGRDEDLDATDQAAMEMIPKERRYQDMDNWLWIRDAKSNALVVGSKARILYSDELGRVSIALRFNELVREGIIGPVMLGRDHHDPGGTDSPFRETSSVHDGSRVMADMATQSFAGNAARGMTMVALHNGGGTGIGNAINGGFGLVLDGSERVDEIIRSALSWDVMVGVARRSWARSENAMETANLYNASGKGKITIPYLMK